MPFEPRLSLRNHERQPPSPSIGAGPGPALRDGQSVIVPWTGAVQPWDASDFASLGPDHFARLAALAPELVVFGSGPRLRFPAPALLRPLIDARIGIETMDTAAACRTYNVLLAEGRSVVAALLFAGA